MNIEVITEARGLTSGAIQEARASGTIVFVYESVDPFHELGLDPFLYVHSAAELQEKVTLLEADPIVRDEVLCL